MSKNSHLIKGKTSAGMAFATMGSYSKVLEIQGLSPGSVISKLDIPGDPSSARPMSDTDPTAGVDPAILARLAEIDAKNGGGAGGAPSGGSSQAGGAQAASDDGQFDRVMASVRSAGLRSLDPELGK